MARIVCLRSNERIDEDHVKTGFPTKTNSMPTYKRKK